MLSGRKRYLSVAMKPVNGSAVRHAPPNPSYTPPMKPICMPTHDEIGDMEAITTPTVCATKANFAAAILTLRTSGRSELPTIRMDE